MDFPAMKLDHGIVVRPFEPEDESQALELLEACSDWFVAATGLPPGPGEVQSLYYGLPEGADFEDKLLLVIEHGDRILGVVDAVARHPEETGCSVGLFLLHPTARRCGIGSVVLDGLVAQARSAGFGYITATCPADRPQGLRFLRTHGFTVEEEASSTEMVGNRRAGPREAGPLRAVLRLTG